MAVASTLAYAELESGVVSLDDSYLPINPVNFDPTSMQIEIRYLAKRCFCQTDSS
ncbi:hypothetical protein IPL68_05525 [Candidatus Saccharibacteria bacterium]|nr:MAG: hypothetical protein IPL68_05525 [Candidatus Saccharibacteria bacterium]